MLISDEDVDDDGWNVVAVTIGDDDDVVSETSDVESAELLNRYLAGCTSASEEVSPVALDVVTGLATGDS